MHLKRACSTAAAAVVTVIVGTGNPASALPLDVSSVAPADVAAEVVDTTTSPASAQVVPTATPGPRRVVETVATLTESVAPVPPPVAAAVAPAVDTATAVTEVVAAAAAPVSSVTNAVAAAVVPVTDSVTNAVAPVTNAVAPVTNAVAPVTNAVTPVSDSVTPAVARITDAVIPADVAVASETVAPLAGPTVMGTAPLPALVISAYTAADPAPGLAPFVEGASPIFVTSYGVTNAITPAGAPQVVPSATGLSSIAAASGAQFRSSTKGSMSPERSLDERRVSAARTAATGRVERRRPAQEVFWGWFGTFFAFTGFHFVRVVLPACAALFAGGALVFAGRRRSGLRR